ncbi:MAG: class I SAM-dependent methyltransferase, partial [Chloroflexi bacterium]|nr:class I SAM-dependent methyltransferase [Chloroflexota bacterium]
MQHENKREIVGHPEGIITRGTTAPNRLRRVDRWLCATHAAVLKSSREAPLVVDLGFGASPVTTIELFQRLREVRADVEVMGVEIDSERVDEGIRFLKKCRQPADYQGLTFQLGGFELPTPRPPVI